MNFFLKNSGQEVLEAVKNSQDYAGTLSESTFKILKMMMHTGFFDNPFGTNDYRELMNDLKNNGRQAVRDSLVLLKSGEGKTAEIVESDWFNRVPEAENKCDTLILNLSGRKVENIKSEFTGLMPFTIYDEKNISSKHRLDVPFDSNSYQDGKNNNYLYGFGMNSYGIIGDERVDKYNSETWDAVDRDEKQLGFCVPRYMAKTMEKGMYHVIVVIFTVTRDGKILTTQRAPEKTYAYKWEVTGGSILSGETPRQGAVRELFEETGLRAEPEMLVELGRHVDDVRHGIYHAYINVIDNEPDSITLQDKETMAWKFLNIEEFFSFAASDNFAAAERERIKLYREITINRIIERLNQ